MKLIVNSKKPALVKSASLPLCDFRSGKGYLWSLTRDRLAAIQSRSPLPLYMLDAACHALIARGIFPPKSFYYGLDISSFRLSKAVARASSGDVLYRADLTSDLSLDSMFNVVVSLNTMSHLPSEQQRIALNHLVSSCCIGGDLLINFSLTRDLSGFSQYLLQEFKSVEPIYFESFLSVEDEKKRIIDSSNIAKKILENELSVPNDACLHRQVLFHARERRKGSQEVGNAPKPLSSSQVLQLNAVPNVSVKSFANDLQALGIPQISLPSSVVCFTSFLLSSTYGQSLVQELNKPVVLLQAGLELPAGAEKIFIFGLESSWSENLAEDRIAINELRSQKNVSIVFVLVSSRLGQACQPSLVAQDF